MASDPGLVRDSEVLDNEILDGELIEGDDTHLRPRSPRGEPRNASPSLERDPQARFASIQEVAARLAPFGYADTVRAINGIDRPPVGSASPPPLPVPRNRSIVPVALSTDAGRRHPASRPRAVSRWVAPAIIGAGAGCLATLAVGWSGQGDPFLPSHASGAGAERVVQPLLPSSSDDAPKGVGSPAAVPSEVTTPTGPPVAIAAPTQQPSVDPSRAQKHPMPRPSRVSDNPRPVESEPPVIDTTA